MALRQQPKSKVRAVLFDLDNTLIPTRKGDRQACDALKNVLVQKYGMLEISAEESTNIFLESFRLCPHNTNMCYKKWRIQLWEEALPKNYKLLASEVYKEWLLLRYNYVLLPPAVKSLLLNLRSNYLLGLITNGSSSSQWEKVQQLKLSDYFDCILVSGDLPWEKPHQNIFLKACQVLNVKPQDCVMVGDKLETDIVGAKQASLAGAIWVADNKKQHYPLKSSPDYTLDSVIELKEILHSNDQFEYS